MTKLQLFDKENKAQVLKFYGKTEDALKEDIEIMKEWVKGQKHLPEETADDTIERFLILNKCSIERAKEKLDMYYTIRDLLPEFYENKNPKHPHMKYVSDKIYSVMLPKLSPDKLRVGVCKFNIADDEEINVLDFAANVLNMAEIRLTEDYALSDVYVLDCDGFRLSHLRLFSPMLIKKFAMILEKVYSSRVSGIHFINAPSYIDTLASIVKSCMKPKLAQRIQVHRNIDTLFEFVPKSMLPSDYGGEEKSLAELNGMWQKKLTEYQERFDKLEAMKVNEELRPQKLQNDDILGFHGNFKKLCVD